MQLVQKKRISASEQSIGIYENTYIYRVEGVLKKLKIYEEQ